jgi:hypothetical protein
MLPIQQHTTLCSLILALTNLCIVCISTIQVPDFGAEVNEDDDAEEGTSSMIVQFTSMEGDSRGPQVCTSFNHPRLFKKHLIHKATCNPIVVL